jgi:hypothetical protein
VHVRNTENSIIQREMNFDSPMKKLAAQKIMEYLPNTGTPRLLTLASLSGNCVTAALARNPKTRIDNIESDSNVLSRWQLRKKELGVETVDYNCLFQDFIKAPGFSDCHYDLVNADLMGYASEPMYRYLSILNKTKNADTIAITTQYLRGFRNHGTFQEALRKKYAGKADPHMEAIVDWLPDYTLVECFDYRQGWGKSHMDVFIFKLGDS